MLGARGRAGGRDLSFRIIGLGVQTAAVITPHVASWAGRGLHIQRWRRGSWEGFDHHWVDPEQQYGKTLKNLTVVAARSGASFIYFYTVRSSASPDKSERSCDAEGKLIITFTFTLLHLSHLSAFCVTYFSLLEPQINWRTKMLLTHSFVLIIKQPILLVTSRHSLTSRGKGWTNWSLKGNNRQRQFT